MTRFHAGSNVFCAEEVLQHNSVLDSKFSTLDNMFLVLDITFQALDRFYLCVF